MMRSVFLALSFAAAALASPLNLAAYASNDDTPKVSLELYFEALCPYCHQFITKQLMPAIDDGLDEILDVTLVPYGNAKETPQMHIGGGYDYTCQHGPQECSGNRMLGCAINLAADTFSALQFVACMAHADATPEDDGFTCALSAGLDYKTLKHCYNNNQGWKILHQNAVKTASLDPPHSYVPWIVVNGKHTEEIQAAAQADLVGLVCQVYGGTKPSVCPSPKYSERHRADEY